MTTKKICSIFVAFVVAVAMIVPSVLIETNAATSTVTLNVSGKTTSYDTVAEAVAAVPTDETEAVISLNEDFTGAGVKVTAGKNIVFNLNGNTWKITDTVGSAGTETNGLQLLKDSKVKLMNGSITSDTAVLLIQNYCELTLDSVVLSGKDNLTNLIVSNNNGKTTIKGDTEIKAAAGGNAMDSDFWSDNVYTGGNVVFESGTIIGDVVATNGGKMALNGGTIKGNVKVENYGNDKYSNISGKIIIDGTSIEGNVIAEDKGSIEIKSGSVTGIVKSTGENAVDISGGVFAAIGEGANISSDMQATVTSKGATKVVIGKQAVKDAIANLKDGDKIEFQSVSDDAVIEIPEGVEITNNTGKDMTINGVTVADGKTVTVEKEPVNPSEPNADEDTSDKADTADKESESPKTGDDTMVLGYAIIMLAALGLGGTLVITRKKN